MENYEGITVMSAGDQYSSESGNALASSSGPVTSSLLGQLNVRHDSAANRRVFVITPRSPTHALQVHHTHNPNCRFPATKKVLHTFLCNCTCRNGALQANRNDFYFVRNTGRPEANSTNQSCDYIQPMAAALQNGVVHCVKKYTSCFGAAEHLQYLRFCITTLRNAENQQLQEHSCR